ncbi:MAG: ATP-grasp domain-containing protein [Gammaproteobacteria bacterium]
MPNYLVIATSGRAIAQGLASLGCSVAVVDGFADCDTCAAATEVQKIKRTQFGLDHHSVVQAIQYLLSKTSFDGVFFDAAIESNSELLEIINIHPVLGNSSRVIESVKNAEIFFSKLDQYSIPHPKITFNSSSNLLSDDAWLLKHAHGTGGVGVTPINADVVMPENVYFQKKLDGVCFSITFLANGNDIYALGFNTLWHESLGISMPYAYAGAINQVKLDDSLQKAALKYTKVLIKEFELVGLNSIDFIYANDSIYVLEINPRIPATYELYESKYGELIEQHIQACLHQILPKTRSKPLLRAHAIVYAPTEIMIPGDMSWPLWAADRPQSQEVIKKFEPVCSIFAGGKNTAQACEMIKSRKQSILAKFLVKSTH